MAYPLSWDGEPKTVGKYKVSIFTRSGLEEGVTGYQGYCQVELLAI